jgi:hypothetical protein
MATMPVYDGEPMFSIEMEAKLECLLFCSLKHGAEITSDSITSIFSSSYNVTHRQLLHFRLRALW